MTGNDGKTFSRKLQFLGKSEMRQKIECVLRRDEEASRGKILWIFKTTSLDSSLLLLLLLARAEGSSEKI